MRVHEAWQRRGVGTALADAAALAARRAPCRCAALYLTVNRSNAKGRAFYAARGFAPVSERLLVFTPLVDVWVNRAWPVPWTKLHSTRC